jgi:hypothetical protein
MSNKTRAHTIDPAQGVLPLAPGCGSLTDAFENSRALLSRLLRASRLSRAQICDRLSALVGRRLTVAQLNAWTAATNANRLPADVLVGLLHILGAYEPLDVLLAAVGRATAGPRRQDLAELGQLTLDQEDLDARRANVRRRLGR